MKKFSCLGLSALIWVSAMLPAVAGSGAVSTFSATPISDNEVHGIEYLIAQQNEDGSWSQGEESKYMQSVGQRNADLHNVADTCMAALAVMRVGNRPDKGKYAKNLAKATEFVCKSVEDSDKDSLLVTSVRGTRVQMKLGQYVDTFLAANFLPEVKDHMPTPEGNERVATALSKVVQKIERNQGKDGSFTNGGWAPVHSQSLALQGLNKAKQAGIHVDDIAMSRAENNIATNFDSRSGGFAASGTAGVPLYAAAATLGGMQSSMSTFYQTREKLQHIAADSHAARTDRDIAERRLKEYKEEEAQQSAAIAAVGQKLHDNSFVQGFGCNGGEEFLSYLQISQTLLANSNKEFPEWNKSISDRLLHVQNSDGSWMGQHCITSRTFCTAAALMVLLADQSDATRSIAAKD